MRPDMIRLNRRGEDLGPVNDSSPIASVSSGEDNVSENGNQQVIRKPYDQRVILALRQVIRAVDLHSRWMLSQYQITGPQLITLLTIEKEAPVTASAIASHILLSPSTVIGILDRLESKGLIRRNRDLRDRRMIWISLTEEGKIVASNAPSPLQDTLAEAIVRLPETEVLKIVESLERIVELMQIDNVEIGQKPDP
jgi:DNA-binding MarR family transcriptional regulator